MKLKYHKIKNVPREICTCEQKIAYNFASSYCDILLKNYKAAPTGLQRMDVIWWAVNQCRNSYNRGDISSKYNLDAIICALHAGLENYINADYHILDSYKEIGKMFPANYL